MSLPPLPDAVLQALDATAPTHIVHVGGGDGSVLAAVLRRLPRATAALVDRTDAVAAAGPVLDATGVAERVDVVTIDRDGPIPSGGDVYLIVARDGQGMGPLLVRCRAAMAAAAWLVACEPADTSDPAVLAALVEGAGFAVEPVDGTEQTDHPDQGWRVVVARPHAE